jgi:hypothetical protein
MFARIKNAVPGKEQKRVWRGGHSKCKVAADPAVQTNVPLSTCTGVQRLRAQRKKQRPDARRGTHHTSGLAKPLTTNGVAESKVR